MSNIDWLSIRNEYINTNISYRKLAEKHNVSFNTLKDRAIKEKWADLKKQQHNKITTKIQQKTADRIITKEVNRIDRLQSAADTLLDKAEQAITELNKHMLINEVKTKTTTYTEGGETVETTKGSKSIAVKQGLVKVNALKQIADALKVIKELQTDAGDEDKKDSALIEAIENSANEGWEDEVSEVQPEADKGFDMVGEPDNQL